MVTLAAFGPLIGASFGTSILRAMVGTGGAVGGVGATGRETALSITFA